MFFISLVALGSGVLNSYNRFAVPALNQTLLNVVMIISAGLIAPYFTNPALVLAIGVFVAGVVQLVAQFPALHRLGLLPRPRFDRAHEGVRRIARLMLPGIFGSSVAQVSLLLDSVIASFFVVGSVTWLYSADRLVEFPMGVFSIALATVILPGLASHHSENNQEQFNTTLDWALRLTLTVVVPAAVGLLMLSGPLISTIFGYGAFTHRDVLMCGYALMAYSLGLIGFSMVKVLAPGYYARQDTKTPVKVGIIALSVNMGFNLCVVVPALRLGFPIPHILLAVSTGLSALVNSALLYRGLRRDGIYRPSAAWKKLLPQIGLATVAMTQSFFHEKSALFWVWLSAFVVALDQLTKWYVVGRFELYEILPVGTYLLRLTGVFQNSSNDLNNSRLADCTFTGESVHYGNDIAGAQLNPAYSSLTFESVLPVSSGGIDVNCSSPLTGISVHGRRLTATQLNGSVVVQ